MNVLIVKLSAIGDVVHTLPSLRALRKLYPDAHVTWVVEEAAADLLAGHPDLNRVIVSSRKRWVDSIMHLRGTGATAKEVTSFLKTLRDRRYDLVIDFHGLFKSAVIVLASGGRRKLGYKSMQELSGLFYNEKIPEDMAKHAVDRYLDFARHLGAPAAEAEFIIPIDDEHRKRVHTLLVSKGIDPAEAFVAINPVAYWDTKLWENEKFARLSDRIAKELGMKLIFTGGGGDETIGRIRAMMTAPSVSLEGETSLRELAYLYKISRLVVTTDSGPMHIAAAVGTPTVALFGPTDPRRTGPYGEGHTVIRKNLPCSPCFRKECDTMKCMRDISVEEVFEAVGKSLSGIRKAQ